MWTSGRLSLALCALSPVLLVSQAHAAGKDVQRLWEYWVRKDALVATLNETVETVADDVLRGTPYAGRLRINEPPRPNHLNIFMVRAAFAGDVRGRCEVAPLYEAVICDANFVNDFVHSIQIDLAGTSEPEALAAASDYYKRFLTFWLLAHEMAHVVLDHGKDQPKAGAWGNLAEADADTFVLTHMAGDQQLQFSGYMTLSQMATSIYLAELAREHSPEAIEKVYEEIRAAGGEVSFSVPLPVHLQWNPERHPPWLIRVLTMAELLFRHYPAMVDTSGYWERLEANVLPEKVPVDGRPEADWKGGDPLLDTLPVSPLDGFVLEAEAEQLLRLILLGDDLAEQAIGNFAAKAQGSAPDAYIQAVVGCLKATLAWRRGDAAAAEAELAAVGTPAEPDLFLAGLWYLTQVRLQADAEQRASMAERFPDLIIAVAEPEGLPTPSERAQLRAMIGIWEIGARGWGFEDQRVSDYTGMLLQYLSEKPYAMLKSDFLARWRDMIIELPPTGPEALVKANQLLSIAEAAMNFGRSIEAVAAISAALLIVEAIPDLEPQPQFMAYWNDMAAREFMGLGLPEKTVAHATRALEYRRQALELEIALDPSQAMHGRMQVSLALNQVGFAYIIAQQYDKARVALEEALAIREQEGDDPAELATVRHNLAQAYIALGDPRGAELARLAHEVRRDLQLDPLLVANSVSLRAGAEYLAGNTASARKLTAKYLDTLAALQDFRIPTSNVVMVIDGTKVDLAGLLGDLVLVSEEVERLPSIYPDKVAAILASEEVQLW